MKKQTLAAMAAAMILSAATTALAHSPICTCYDGGDGTITCEGGFSDGSSGGGVVMLVQDASGKEILKGAMSKDAEFNFKKPAGDYQVIFDAGEGHRVVVKGKDIVR